MTSYRDELLGGLPSAMREKALRLGASARLADDDIAWVLLVAATRLDLDLLSNVASDRVAKNLESVIPPMAERAISRISANVVKLVSDSIDQGMAVVITRQNNRQLVLALVLALIYASSVILAAAAGAQGWTHFQRDEITGLNERLATLQRSSPPPWLTWWGQAADGTPMIFARLGVRDLSISSCSSEREKGVCISAQAH